MKNFIEDLTNTSSSVDFIKAYPEAIHEIILILEGIDSLLNYDVLSEPNHKQAEILKESLMIKATILANTRGIVADNLVSEMLDFPLNDEERDLVKRTDELKRLALTGGRISVIEQFVILVNGLFRKI